MSQGNLQGDTLVDIQKVDMPEEDILQVDILVEEGKHQVLEDTVPEDNDRDDQDEKTAPYQTHHAYPCHLPFVLVHKTTCTYLMNKKLVRQ